MHGLKRASFLLVAAGLLVLGALATTATAQTPTPSNGAVPTAVATAALQDVNGNVVGVALLSQYYGAPVRVQVWASGLTPGEHGIHLHEVGACTPSFAAAGAHFNPTGARHGLDNPLGPHAGDLPALMVGADGSGMLDTTTDRITLETGPDRSLFDADGSSLVIHANPDDQVTDPAGGSGDPVACGVIGKTSLGT